MIKLNVPIYTLGDSTIIFLLVPLAALHGNGSGVHGVKFMDGRPLGGETTKG